MVRILYTGKYQKNLDELIREKPDINQEINKRVGWSMRNPKDTRLDDHALTKRMEDKWAFSITNDIRIVYEWAGKNTARLLTIGKHSQVYFSRS